MGALLGGNDAKKVVISMGPPSGPLGIALTDVILALLPDGSGYTFPFQFEGKMAPQYANSARDNPVNTIQGGADGKVNYSTSHNKTGKFTLSLMQTSLGVSLLTALLIYQEQTGLLPVFSMSITDTLNGSKHEGIQCVVEGYPSRSFSSDAAATYEFVILVAELQPLDLTVPLF